MSLLQNLFLYLLLVLALSIAWYTGRKSGQRKARSAANTESDYFIGLNYLLNDEPDDAVDVFINALEPDRGSLETHLALGTLLRRRGKVDRSISHLQGLLAGYDFSAEELAQIKLQLTRSYIAAGLLDRAEKLLEELEKGTSKAREAALGLAITVYQMEKDWRKAIDAATELARTGSGHLKQEMQLQASHFYCELAEQSMALGNLKSAREELKMAMGICRTNVRVQLLEAQVHASSGNHQEALKILQKVIHQEPLYKAEAVMATLEYMKVAGLEKVAMKMLGEIEPGSDTRLIIELADFIAIDQGDESAVTFLLQQLKKNPSLALLGKAVRRVRFIPGMQDKVMEAAQTVLEAHSLGQFAFRCENCGFELKSLHWHCPGCGKWGSVLPLDDRLSARNPRGFSVL